MHSKHRANVSASSKNTTMTMPATTPLHTHTAPPLPPASLPETRSRRSSTNMFVTLLRSPAGFLRSSVTTRTRPLSSPSTPTTSSNVSLPAVVLQTYSASTEGIVLTTLPTAPFCCHEDLLTMPREKLEDVVRALNEKLPRRMQIGATAEKGDRWMGDEDEDIASAIAHMSDAEIRRKIEVLVGIRRREGLESGKLSVPFESVPAAAPAPELLGTCAETEIPVSPKSVDTPDHERRRVEDKEPVREVDVDGSHAGVELSTPENVHAITSSPPRGRGHTLPPLTALAEEHEIEEQDDTQVENSPGETGDEAKNIEEAVRAVKRRRVSSGGEEKDQLAFIPTWSGPHGCLPTIQGSRLLENFEVSALPLLDIDDDVEMISATTKVAPSPVPTLSRLRRRWSPQVQRKRKLSTENPDVTGKDVVFHPPPGARRVKARPLSLPVGRSWSVLSSKDGSIDLGETASGGAEYEVLDYEGSMRCDRNSRHHSDTESNDSKSKSSVLRVHPAGAVVALNGRVDVDAHANGVCIATKQDKLERSKSEHHPSKVSTDRPRKRFSFRRSSWAAAASGPNIAGLSYGSGVTLASESDSTTGSGLGFQPDDDHAADRSSLRVSMAGLHAKTGNANSLAFDSSLSVLGPRSEHEQAMSISTVTSVRDALDVDELRGNIRVEEDLQDSEGDVHASPIVFASRESMMDVDLDRGVAEGIWVALEKMEVMSVEAGMEV